MYQVKYLSNLSCTPVYKPNYFVKRVKRIMGQVASRRRRHHYLSVNLKKEKNKNKAKKNSLEVWRQVKDMEISRLQEASEKEFENVKRKIMCQSFLLKEIFEDTLKMQRENHDKEIAELKKEIMELKKAMMEMKK